MAVKGEFAKLEAWEQLLDSGDALLRPMSAAMAEEAIDLIQDGFRAETDPYGVPWQKKKRPDGRKVLSGPTNRAKSGWHRRQSDQGGFEVAPSVDYLAPHQAPRTNPATGQLKRPRRMVVPSSEKGLPEKWKDAFEEVALDSLVSWFRTSLKGAGGSARMGKIQARIAAAKRQIGLRRIIRQATSGDDGEED